LQESDSEGSFEERNNESNVELDMDSAFMDAKPAARVSGSISTVDEASGQCKPSVNQSSGEFKCDTVTNP
jgi:hypothetical protein